LPGKKLVSGIVKEIDDVVVTVTIKEPGRGKAYAEVSGLRPKWA